MFIFVDVIENSLHRVTSYSADLTVMLFLPHISNARLYMCWNSENYTERLQSRNMVFILLSDSIEYFVFIVSF